MSTGLTCNHPYLPRPFSQLRISIPAPGSLGFTPQARPGPRTTLRSRAEPVLTACVCWVTDRRSPTWRSPGCQPRPRATRAAGTASGSPLHKARRPTVWSRGGSGCSGPGPRAGRRLPPGARQGKLQRAVMFPPPLPGQGGLLGCTHTKVLATEQGRRWRGPETGCERRVCLQPRGRGHTAHLQLPALTLALPRPRGPSARGQSVGIPTRSEVLGHSHRVGLG